jgi:hypothetical protein
MFQRRRFKPRRSGNSASTSGSTSSGRNNHHIHHGQYHHYDSQSADLNNNYNNTGNGTALANFDACIEACDALAASSGVRFQYGYGSSSHSQSNEDNKDNKDNGEDGEEDSNTAAAARATVEYTSTTSISTGKSMMISPDGELLSCNTLAPPSTTTTTTTTTSSRHNIQVKDDKNNDSSSSLVTSQQEQEEQQQEGESLITSTKNDNGPLSSCFSSSRDDEIESAIYIGNDVVLDGEKVLNGFSARGWNPIMTTMAIRRAVDTLQYVP